jgi:hypothetical protein
MRAKNTRSRKAAEIHAEFRKSTGGLCVADRSSGALDHCFRDLAESVIGACVLGRLRHDLFFGLARESRVAIYSDVSAI